MSWLTWRQYRLQLAAVAGLIAVFGAVLLVTGLRLAAQWHADLAACAVSHACVNQPPPALGSALASDLTVIGLLVPGALGILWGAPLAAGEFEADSVDFAWTQGITRSHWLAVKSGWLLLSAAVAGGAAGALLTWWSGPRNAATADALRETIFDTQGIVPAGYAVFAVALGIAAGVLLRRTLPAIAVTLAGFIGARVLVAQFLRAHLLPPSVAYSPALSGTWPFPHGPSVILSSGMADRYGHVIPDSLAREAAGVPVTYMSAACQKLVSPFAYTGRPGDFTPVGSPTAAAKRAIDACAQASGVRSYVSYQPAGHYWPLQLIETGIFVALAAALVAVACAVLSRRDA